MDERAAEQLLQGAVALLHVSLTEAKVFFERWHEQYEGLDENYRAYCDSVKRFNSDLSAVIKHARGWENFGNAVDTSRELLNIASKLHDIITGPLVIIRASRDVAALSDQVAKLIHRTAPRGGDEEGLLDSLEAWQVAQIYQWVSDNNAARPNPLRDL